ncbi:MAG: signal peptidase I [Candidatus Woesearchaeota archaeon]
MDRMFKTCGCRPESRRQENYRQENQRPERKPGIAWRALPFMIIFLLGWTTGSMASNYGGIGTEKPLSAGLLLGFSPELASPSDHIPEKSIHVLDDKVILDVQDARWASFTDTNSMDPFIDKGANSIEIEPESEDDISVGDVISFTTEYDRGIIIHRVISKGKDDKGTYYITKGDNSPSRDPGKRRIEDVKGVVVGVIY